MRPVAEGASTTEPVIDQALALLEHLTEIAEGMMRRLDEFLNGDDGDGAAKVAELPVGRSN